MKKMILAVMMLIGASAAFAGDSEPLKAILKAQNYAEAANLLQSTLEQLAGNAFSLRTKPRSKWVKKATNL